MDQRFDRLDPFLDGQGLDRLTPNVGLVAIVLALVGPARDRLSMR
jgi:hypothetical protein